MQIFAFLREKPIKIWNFRENFNITIQKSQWKIDFLRILSAIFHELSSLLGPIYVTRYAEIFDDRKEVQFGNMSHLLHKFKL